MDDSQPRPTRLRGWLRRHRAKLATVLAVAVVAFGSLTARLFVWPATDAARTVDAVTIFVGGRGERLALAEQLMDRGLSD